MLEKGLRTKLLADATVSGLVGARIYPLRLPPDGAYPALTYERVSSDRERTFDGPRGDATARIRITCWAKDNPAASPKEYGYDGARSLADAVRAAINGFTGLMGAVTVYDVRFETDADSFNDEASLWFVEADYVIHFEES